MALHDIFKLYILYFSSKNSIDLMRQGWASPILLWSLCVMCSDRVNSVPARDGLWWKKIFRFSYGNLFCFALLYKLASQDAMITMHIFVCDTLFFN